MTSVLIGNFDGVHTGHQALIRNAREAAVGSLSALTFSPHPRGIFNPDIKPFRLCDDETRAQLLRQYGVDDVITLSFDQKLAGLSAHEFIDTILIEKLRVDTVIVGADFHFGKGRSGSTDTLREDGRLDVRVLNLVEEGGVIVSSSRIRQHLANAEMDQANRLLGWDWFIGGQVIQGDRRGRLLGYPTANIDPGVVMMPSHGIYAVRVEVNGRSHHGVASMGMRPMYRLKSPLIEVFIFDFQADIYGQHIRVFPVLKLRNEAMFEDEGALKKQMAQDVEDARLALARAID